MKEKDIENLIARYPSEFLSYSNLRLKGQQVRIDSYIADIVFEDDNSTIVIIEVKKGILRREAVAQIYDYYGSFKGMYPNKELKLILIANVIPPERVRSLSELSKIDCLEIPDSKIIEIAKKVGYVFLDENEFKGEIEHYRKIAKDMEDDITINKTKVWIFQANPKRYDILNAMTDPSLEDGVWLVNQYRNEIKAGNIGIIWMSGQNGGIYGIVEILTNPLEMYDTEQSTKYWVFEEDRNKQRLRVKYKYKLKLINNPIRINELKRIPELQNLTIFKQPQGTNFPVKDEEWEIISNLIQEKLT